ncbi:MAG: hypothetical protein LBK75_01650 [Oscillospiraceae bacterium]|nr:hypothetical protein [Oscillospiraceae bacterium]
MHGLVEQSEEVGDMFDVTVSGDTVSWCGRAEQSILRLREWHRSQHHGDRYSVRFAVQVNTDMMELYWNIGNEILRRQMKRLYEMEVPIVKQAINAYREIVVSPEFRELERLRSLARHNEASALLNAEQKGEARADAKWQAVVADKDAEIARLRTLLDETE